MSKALPFLSAVLVAALGGCATTPSSMKDMKVRAEHDPKARFRSTGSYSWMTIPGKLAGDARSAKTTTARRMREVIEEELGRKGYEHRGLGYKVDFMVCYYAAVEKDLDAESAAKQRGYTSQDLGGSGQRFEKGTLVIDIVHPETNELMWRGIAEADIVVSVSEAEKLKRTSEAVRRILAKFPPK